MNYEVLEALSQIVKEKNVNRDLVIETLEAGLLSAAKKRFGTAENIEVKIDGSTGKVEIFSKKKVVEEVNDPVFEISLEKAREIDPDVNIGDIVREEISFQSFGRNAIQTAKQILIQRVREAEREKIYEDYKGRIGEIITGTAQQVNRGDILVNLGRAEGVIPAKEQIRKERYRQGDTIRAYIVDVQRTTKGPQIILSRTHPRFLEKLFQIEVPEIYEGIVEIKAIAREPGERAKVAVMSHDSRIDPVGACVGMKGSRVQAIVRELGNERIDIVHWSNDPSVFLARALSPAEIKKVIIDEKTGNMTAIVDESQLSLAIGRNGQNVRLAAMLLGRNIDIMTEEDYEERLRAEMAQRIPLDRLSGVGPKLLERLNEAGINSVQDLLEISPEKLTEIKGIGRATAENLLEQAKEIIESRAEAGEAEEASEDGQ